MKRLCAIAVLFSVAWCAAQVRAASAGETIKPNVVVILADDKY